jgi:glyoxylase-like metal-dependent hydrolase (beta-lactamase superfamily II)
LAALGRGLDCLDAVLITHAHSDHTGVAERARTTATAPVWLHHADAAVAKGAKPTKNDGKARSYLLRVEFYRTLVSLARRGATKLIPIGSCPPSPRVRRWRCRAGRDGSHPLNHHHPEPL